MRLNVGDKVIVIVVIVTMYIGGMREDKMQKKPVLLSGILGISYFQM